jgi:hypothetical protein
MPKRPSRRVMRLFTWCSRRVTRRVPRVSCFCGQTHTSLATALACPDCIGVSQSAPAGKNTLTQGDRSVSPHQDSVSKGEFPVTSRLMGRRLAPVGEQARNLIRARGEGLLRTAPRGGRPPLSLEERRRRARERKRRERSTKKGSRDEGFPRT